MLIAAGKRKVSEDASGHKFVKFDLGFYMLPEDADTFESEGDEWTWCEAHIDTEKETGHALIGGKRVKLAVEPEQFSDDD